MSLGMSYSLRSSHDEYPTPKHTMDYPLQYTSSTTDSTTLSDDYTAQKQTFDTESTVCSVRERDSQRAVELNVSTSDEELYNGDSLEFEEMPEDDNGFEDDDVRRIELNDQSSMSCGVFEFFSFCSPVEKRSRIRERLKAEPSCRKKTYKLNIKEEGKEVKEKVETQPEKSFCDFDDASIGHSASPIATDKYAQLDMPLISMSDIGTFAMDMKDTRTGEKHTYRRKTIEQPYVHQQEISNKTDVTDVTSVDNLEHADKFFDLNMKFIAASHDDKIVDINTCARAKHNLISNINRKGKELQKFRPAKMLMNKKLPLFEQFWARKNVLLGNDMEEDYVMLSKDSTASSFFTMSDSLLVPNESNLSLTSRYNLAPIFEENFDRHISIPTARYGFTPSIVSKMSDNTLVQTKLLVHPDSQVPDSNRDDSEHLFKYTYFDVVIPPGKKLGFELSDSNNNYNPDIQQTKGPIVSLVTPPTTNSLMRYVSGSSSVGSFSNHSGYSKIRIGDHVIAIDDLNTTDMSSKDVMKVLKKTRGTSRKVTFMSLVSL